MDTSQNLLGFSFDNIKEYFDLDDRQTEKEISKIIGLLDSDLYSIGASGTVVYDGVELTLLTDCNTISELEKRDCFFRRNLSYILKKYSKMLLPYNKNYNEEEVK